MKKYFDELTSAMNWLAKKDNSIFIGQAVECPGTAMFNSLKDVDPEKRIELPVFEDTQMGMSLGLALKGYKVISIYPRWNFLLCATNQLVNHVDKFPLIQSADNKNNIIIRTAVGSIRPLHPGHQHIGNFTEAYKKMLETVDVLEVKEVHEIMPAYQKAYERDDGISTLVVEYMDFYNEK
jgi:pyruvate/2-oxoglutarate/acetoin dehydrogenase E1 component